MLSWNLPPCARLIQSLKKVDGGLTAKGVPEGPSIMTVHLCIFDSSARLTFMLGGGLAVSSASSFELLACALTDWGELHPISRAP